MMNKLPDKLTVKRKLQCEQYESDCPFCRKEKNITNSGDYTISVAGKQAEGSISFHILRNEE